MLVYQGYPPAGWKILTVENYCKWYSLYAVHSTGLIEEVSFDRLEPLAGDFETAVGDHVPNPAVVTRFANLEGYDLDPQAFEMIIGRWEIEHNNRYFEDD